MEQATMIGLSTLPYSGVSQTTLKLKCQNINAIKHLISLINEQIISVFSTIIFFNLS